jgi:transposase
VSVVGVLTDHPRQAADAVAVDADQAFGLSDSTPFAEVLEHGVGLLLGQMGVEQGRALAFGEAVLAGLAVEEPDVVPLAVAGAGGEVSGVATAVEGALGILAAEAFEIVHWVGSPGRRERVGIRDGKRETSGITTLIHRRVFNSSGTRPELPPLRILLVLDNLAGHKTAAFVCWLFAHGIMPLYTPLGGSWLNMAESIQRILKRRALGGQHPERPDQIIGWFEAVARHWNADPTPFRWGGKRMERRRRQRERCHRVGGSGACTRGPIQRRSRVPYGHQRGK